MSETLCRQLRSRSFCVWRASKTNPGTSGRNIVTQIFLCRQWWTWNVPLCHTMILSNHNSHLLSYQYMWSHPAKNRPWFKFSKTIWAILMTFIPSETLLIQIEVQAVGLPTNLTHSSQLFTVPLTRWKEKVYRKESTGYKVRSKSGCEQASESSTQVLIFTDFFPFCVQTVHTVRCVWQPHPLFFLSSSLLPFKLLHRSDYSVSTWWSSCVALWWNTTVLCVCDWS